MAEGFKSIADMTVVVDANTEKLRPSFEDAKRVVDDFAKKGGQSLTQFDQGFGGFARNVGGKLGGVGAAISGAMALWDEMAKKGRDAAKSLGAEAEYDGAIASLGKLGLTAQDTATSGLVAVASAAQTSAMSVLGLAQSTTEASEPMDKFAKRILAGVRAAADDLATSLQVMNGNMAKTTVEAQDQVDALERSKKSWEALANTIEARFGKAASVPFRMWVDKLNEEAKAAEENADLREKEENEKARTGKLVPNVQTDAKDLTALLGNETRDLERRAEALRKNTAAAAEYTFMRQKLDEAERKKIDLDPEAIKSLEREAAKYGNLTAEIESYTKAKAKAEQEKQRAEQLDKQREKAQQSIDMSVDRDFAMLDDRVRKMTLTADEAARLAYEEKLIMQYKQAGIEVDDQRLASIKQQAVAYGEAVKQTNELDASFALVKQSVDAVARTGESAFRQWLSGAKVDWKSFAAQMLEDMAMMTFKQGVMNPLSSALTSGISSLMGIGGGGDVGLGSWDAAVTPATTFGGYRAEGGPVEAGRRYLVGERGPESFIPNVSGMIQPSGGRPVQIVTNIDARGATTDAIAELKREMARRDSMLPGQVLSVVKDANERGMM